MGQLIYQCILLLIVKFHKNFISLSYVIYATSLSFLSAPLIYRKLTTAVVERATYYIALCQVLYYIKLNEVLNDMYIYSY